MGIILTDSLKARFTGSRPFLVNNICKCMFDLTILSGGTVKIRFRDDYLNVAMIGGEGSFPVKVGDAVFFLKAWGFNGPFPGHLSRVISTDELDKSFVLNYAATGSASFVDTALIFCSPAEMGLFGMFSYATIEAYTGAVPAANDDLDLLTPACRFFDISYSGVFDEENYDSYIKLVYNKSTSELQSNTLVGTPTTGGLPTWLCVSTYCRERTSLSTIALVKYSFIVPLGEDSTVEIVGPMIEGEQCSLNFRIKA